MQNYPQIGIQIPDVLLPAAGVDPHSWAVIACDQFTSQPEYWQEVEKIVDGAPSTLRLILPEVYLGTDEEAQLTQKTQQAMRDYLAQNLLTTYSGLVLVERTIGGKTRRGLMIALDLEQYDFNKGSKSLIRATEGTIIERLPPRIKIREGAVLEVPHILVLLDDPQKTVIEPLLGQRSHLKPLYDFELMLGSGHLRGYGVDDPAVQQQVIRALEKLADPQAFAQKYGVSSDEGVLLFAMGDGNHSLATAKAIWEKIKPTVGMDHPARYALVEVENLHDESLEFEPIHRVVFGVKEDIQAALKAYFGAGYHYEACQSMAEIVERVDHQSGPQHSFGVITANGMGVARVDQPKFNLPVGTLQDFLDGWLKKGGAGKIDYVHGEDVVHNLGSQPGNVGLYLPAMAKGQLFKTVIVDGALPRKTFSMGEAKDKRFYMECRRIA